MIVDGDTVITGSFNFTHNAEASNAENLLILKGREVAARYADNWREHYRHSDPYERAVKKKEQKAEHPKKKTLFGR